MIKITWTGWTNPCLKIMFTTVSADNLTIDCGCKNVSNMRFRYNCIISLVVLQDKITHLWEKPKCKMWYWMINNPFCITFSDVDVLFIRFSYPEWVSPSSLRFSFSLFSFPVRCNQQDRVTNSYIVIANHGNMVRLLYIQPESWKCRIFSSSTKCSWTFFKIYTKTKQILNIYSMQLPQIYSI